MLLNAGLAVGLVFIAADGRSSTSTETMTIIGERPRPRGAWFEDPTVAAEAIDLTDRTAVNESLGDVIEDAAGVRVIRSGGTAAFQGLSIGGTEPDHTSVLVGDLPVFGADRGAVDLSLLPIQAFERVEIFKGAPPAWLDQGQIGGVVRLVPRTGQGTGVLGQFGVGSFDTFWTRAEASIRRDELGVVVAATQETTSNRYRFFSDGATAFDPSDDGYRQRSNADARQAHGAVMAEWSDGEHRIDALALGLRRAQGEPGPGHLQTEQAERTRAQLLGALGYTYEDPDRDLRLAASVNAAWDRDAFEDRLGEIGLGAEADTDDRFLGLGGRLAGQMGLVDGLQATLVTTVRHDRIDPNNAFAVPGDQPSERTTAGGTAELRWYGAAGPVDFEVRPSVSFRVSRARLVGLGRADVRSASEDLLAYRLGLFASAVTWLSIQASVGVGNRLPTVLELFGNRGSLQANADLRAEQGLNWSAGVIADRRMRLLGARARLRFEGRVFGSAIDDLIRYRRTSQFTAVAENVASADIVGVEAAGRVSWMPWLRLVAQGTWLDARDEAGRGLPLRPALTGRVELEARSGEVGFDLLREVRGRIEVTHVGPNWFDEANLVELPGRTNWSVAVVTVHMAGRLRFTYQVRDVFDAGGTDLLGFPLPGRRFDVAATVTEVWD